MTRPHKRLKTRTELQNEKADVDAALILAIKREHEEVGQAAEAAGLFELGLTLPQMKEAMTEMVSWFRSGKGTTSQPAREPTPRIAIKRAQVETAKHDG